VGRQIYPPGAGALVRKARKTVSTGQRARKAKANTRQAEPSGPLSGPYLSATNMKSREITAGSPVMIRTRCHPEPIRFQHRRKISSILIRNTLVPIAIRTAPGSCLVTEGVKSPKIGVVMSIIPLDLQRRCEQRWAARFARQAPEPPSQKSAQEKQDQQLGAPAKAKRKTRRAEPAG
jgi:hypothetical protein